MTCMRRQTGPSHAHPKEVVVVKPAFVPAGLKSGGEAYLLRTWLLQLGKRDTHTYIVHGTFLSSSKPLCVPKGYVITHSSIGSVSKWTGTSNGFNRYQQWLLSQL